MNDKIIIPLFLLCIMLPPELSFSLGSIRLTPYRLILILSFIPLIRWLFVDSVRGRSVKLIDGLVIFHCCWSVVSLIFNEGFLQGIESGGVFFVETLGAYLIARRLINSREMFDYFIKIATYAFIILLPLVLFEMFTRVHVIREVAMSIFGGNFYNIIETRMGLTRAYGSFEHPILLGVFASSFSLLFYYSDVIKRKKSMLSTAVIVSFTSLSSGGIIAIALQGILLAWDKFTNAIALTSKWKKLIFALVIAYILMSFVSSSPLKFFLSKITFSQHTAYFRTIIFEYGAAEVIRNPIFGIGFSDWIRPFWMPPSVDNFWLLTAMRFGLPSLLGLIVAVFLLMNLILKTNKQPIGTAYVITLVSFVFAGCTVHFWNQLLVFFYFFLGLGVALSSTQKGTISSEKI